MPIVSLQRSQVGTSGHPFTSGDFSLRDVTWQSSLMKHHPKKIRSMASRDSLIPSGDFHVMIAWLADVSHERCRKVPFYFRARLWNQLCTSVHPVSSSLLLSLSVTLQWAWLDQSRRPHALANPAISTARPDDEARNKRATGSVASPRASSSNCYKREALVRNARVITAIYRT